MKWLFNLFVCLLLGVSASCTDTKLVASPIGLASAEKIGYHVGPGLICIKDSSFLLAEGETVSMDHGGLHGLTLKLSLSAGTVEYSENEIFSKPKHKGKKLRLSSGVEVMKHGNGSKTRYLFSGPISSWKDGKYRPLLWLSGSAFDGSKDDITILERVKIGPVDRSVCAFNYGYGL